MSERPRSPALSPQFQAALDRILGTDPRALEAWKAFAQTLLRVPELGMAVRGMRGFSSRPFHTETASYLVIYSYDAEEVFCLAIREVPSSSY